MNRLDKYRGIIPAFYACYDDNGRISPDRVKALASYLAGKGVKGLYVGGSSGECIYQSVDERKMVLECVMEAVRGRLTIIAHVACNNTQDSMELAPMRKNRGWMPSQLYRRSISIFRLSLSRSIGMISLQRRRIQISLSIIYLSLQAWRWIQRCLRR